MGERTYRMILSYDGTRYRGWQRLPEGALTVQGSLERALEEIFGCPVPVDGSGRTDAGVHALGQVASFRAPERPTEELLARLRRSLPEDIGVLSLDYAGDRFHARLSAREKTYVYRVWNSPVPDVFGRRFRTQVPQTLNRKAMDEAAACFLGTHDFMCCCANKHMKKSTVRTLKALDIRARGEELTFTLRGDGFLYHMVRILVGTLLEVGAGKRRPEEIPALLESRDRSLAGETAPAKGLCLMEVYY